MISNRLVRAKKESQREFNEQNKLDAMFFKFGDIEKIKIILYTEDKVFDCDTIDCDDKTICGHYTQKDSMPCIILGCMAVLGSFYLQGQDFSSYFEMCEGDTLDVKLKNLVL